MTTEILKTKWAEARASRDLAIYNDWCALTSIEGQSKTRVNEFLMQKYDIHSPATIYVIRKRVEKLIEKRSSEYRKED